ncbi:MAG TPA: biopolymer transporter ExbD [Oligoflexia bacterium]|nr:biopolymer transporter ExbD [Oligoflexia bacterium]
MRSSIKNRRRRHRIKRDFDLQLTSMMDMLIIMVVFLLKSYATNSVAFATSSNIKLPSSTAEEIPADSINLVVEPTGIMFDNEKVMDFANLPVIPSPAPAGFTFTPTYEIESRHLADYGRRILPLYDAMVKSRQKAELMMSKAVVVDPTTGERSTPKFQGVVIIHADKSVKFDILRKIMYTAGSAEFKIFKLVAEKKEEA